MEDRSLDEFLDVSSDGTDDDGDGAGDSRDTVESEQSGDESERSGDAAGDGSTVVDSTPAGDRTVAPAVSASRWDADGLECPACGSTVSRLWREDESHVCGACKRW